MKSRVIAIFAAVFVAAIAFADPADKPIRRTIVIKDGKVLTDNTEGIEFGAAFFGGKRAYLGVSLISMSPDLREHFGGSRDTGVLVDSVEDQSPAAKAGVRSGDIITSVDGKEVASAGDLREAIGDKKDGDSVRLEIQRNRNRSTVVATLVEREGPRILIPRDIEELTSRLGSGPEWHARVESLGGDCDELRARIKDLESRLKDLEKKLQK